MQKEFENAEKKRLIKKSGVYSHTIVEIEAGNTESPATESVKQIISVFGISINDLIK